MLRKGIDDLNRRARFGAVYTLIGAVSVPITFMSIRMFRTIHPIVIGSNNSGDIDLNMSANMKITFFFALFAFTLTLSSTCSGIVSAWGSWSKSAQ